MFLVTSSGNLGFSNARCTRLFGRLNERVDSDKMLDVILKELKIKSMLGQILYQQTRLINRVSSM
jgi:hypothetical protein